MGFTCVGQWFAIWIGTDCNSWLWFPKIEYKIYQIGKGSLDESSVEDATLEIEREMR